MRGILLLLIFFAGSICLYSDVDKEKVVLKHITFGNVTTIHEITKEKYKSQIEWDFSSEKEMPLNNLKAAEISKKWLKNKFPKIKDFVLIELSLVRIESNIAINKWFYYINFIPSDGQFFTPGSNYDYNVVVLLNGEVVEPVVSKK